jgi:hypothetical protein
MQENIITFREHVIIQDFERIVRILPPERTADYGKRWTEADQQSVHFEPNLIRRRRIREETIPQIQICIETANDSYNPLCCVFG